MTMNEQLDADVGLLVMGCDLKTAVAVDYPLCNCIGGTHFIDGMMPQYSTLIEHAWLVVEAMRAQGWIVRVQEMPDGLPLLAGAGWRPEENAEIHKKAVCILYPYAIPKPYEGFGRSVVTEIADTSPVAICRAAVTAMKGMLHLFRGEAEGVGDWVVARDVEDARAVLLEQTGDQEIVDSREWIQLPDNQPVNIRLDDTPNVRDARTPREITSQMGRGYYGGWA